MRREVGGGVHSPRDGLGVGALAGCQLLRSSQKSLGRSFDGGLSIVVHLIPTKKTDIIAQNAAAVFFEGQNGWLSSKSKQTRASELAAS